LPVIGAELELRAGEVDAPPSTSGDRGWWAILLAGVALALLTAIGGHAATTAPIPLSIAVDWIHLLAASLWIGGLLALALIFPRLIRSLGDPEGLATLAGVVPRFSALALGCVQVLAVTGFYQTWSTSMARPGSAKPSTVAPCSRSCCCSSRFSRSARLIGC
jgi:hypothetical protein